MTDITVPAPTFGTENHRSAQFLADAAWKIRHGYTAGGSTVTRGVVQLIDAAALAIDPDVRTTYSTDVYDHPDHPDMTVDNPGDLVEMTYDERRALPARYHQPVYDDLSTPGGWHCAVCWCADDAFTVSWPCDVAQREGATVARAGGMVVSR